MYYSSQIAMLLPMSTEQRGLLFFAWGTSLAAALVAIAVWGERINWHVPNLSVYQLFPLFGLLAYGLMWSHFITSAIRKYYGLGKSVTARYFKITSSIVLVAICLHPGLLSWQLSRDGFGFPPQSYLRHYVAPGLQWVGLLGTVSLFVFLAYELHRWFNDRPWWRFFGYASELAMLGIFYHAFRLGADLQTGWFRSIWLYYGLTLLISLAYIHGVPGTVIKFKKPPAPGRKTENIIIVAVAAALVVDGYALIGG